jgi:hypothetical protein
MAILSAETRGVARWLVKRACKLTKKKPLGGGFPTSVMTKLFDHLNDVARAGIDQHGAIIDHGVAILGSPPASCEGERLTPIAVVQSPSLMRM